MDEGLVTVIGMSIAYVASFIGMGLAWWAWRHRVDGGDREADLAGGQSRPGDESRPERESRPESESRPGDEATGPGEAP